MALLAGGCSGGTGEAGIASSSTGPSAAPAEVEGDGAALAEPSAEVRHLVADLDGRLAIGAGERLAVSAPDGSGLEWLEREPGIIAAQPTWSRQGQQLAWSRTSGDSNELVVLDFASGLRLTSTLIGTAAFYLQWSFDDDTLAYLHNDPNQGGLELALVDPGSFSVPMGAASPFFVSWAPTASRLAVHVSEQQVILLPSPFAIGAGQQFEPVEVLNPSGPFTTPVWVDASTLLVVSAQGLVTLDLASGAESVVARTDGPVEFVLSPDRTRVAYREPGQAASVSGVSLTQLNAAGGLTVVELASGKATQVTGSAPIAFEWGPDSRHLAWLEPGISAIQPRVRWNFWDGEDTTPSALFQLTTAARERYLPFFEQFAQSVTGWSPDSSAFAFAGRLDGATDDTDAIWVQLLEADGAPPVRVADGDVVIWSP